MRIIVTSILILASLSGMARAVEPTPSAPTVQPTISEADQHRKVGGRFQSHVHTKAVIREERGIANQSDLTLGAVIQ